MQARLVEAGQDTDRDEGERYRQEVCDARRRERCDHASGQSARYQSCAFEQTKAAQLLLEAIAAAGLLDQDVIDDRVSRARLEREVAPKQQCRRQVHRNARTDAADDGAGGKGQVSHDENSSPAPTVRQDARRDLEEGHDHGVGRGKEADTGRRESDLVQEEFLYRCPEVDAEKEAGHIKGPKASTDALRGPGTFGLSLSVPGIDYRNRHAS